MTRRRAGIALGIAVSVALLWWTLRDVSAAELWERLRRSDPWLLGAAVAVATGTFGLRALRWRVLLTEALPVSGFGSRFRAVCIGFMTNNVLPLRVGEFTRAYALARTEPIGVSASFASLVAERVFDGLVLLLLLVPALFSPALAEAPVVRTLSTGAAAAVAVVLALVVVAVRMPEALERGFGRLAARWLPRGLAERLTGMLTSFLRGLGSFRGPRAFAAAFVWSLVVWLWNGIAFWLALLAFDITAPGFVGALFVQSVVGFAVAIPSSPGFFGPFEAASRVSLSLYAVEPARIVSFAAGFHILSFIPVTLLGLWYAHRLGMSLAEVERSEEAVEAAVEAEEARRHREVEALDVHEVIGPP